MDNNKYTDNFNVAEKAKNNIMKIAMPITTDSSLAKINSIGVFKNESKLSNFIKSKNYTVNLFFRVYEILTILRDIIRTENLKDATNPSIILCTPELEEALNMKALHIGEFRTAIIKDLVIIQEDFAEEYFQIPKIFLGGFENQYLINTPPTSNPIRVTSNDKFTCNPKFLAVLRTLPEVSAMKEVFTYGELTVYLSKYILKNKCTFFDMRNIKIALVAKDLLGEAFGVNTFHKSQVHDLLQRQITPFFDILEIKIYSSASQDILVQRTTHGQIDHNVQTDEEIELDQQTPINSDPTEYEPQTPSESERPPQAGGRPKSQYSTESDTGDCEKMEIDIENTEEKTCSTQNCIQPITGKLTRCQECWTKKKQWQGTHKKVIKKSKIPELKIKKDVLNDFEEKCELCLTESRNAIFVHGTSGHQFGCYTCAKKHWQSSKSCPVCRKTINKVIKFWPKNKAVCHQSQL